MPYSTSNIKLFQVLFDVFFPPCRVGGCFTKNGRRAWISQFLVVTLQCRRALLCGGRLSGVGLCDIFFSKRVLCFVLNLEIANFNQRGKAVKKRSVLAYLHLALRVDIDKSGCGVDCLSLEGVWRYLKLASRKIPRASQFLYRPVGNRAKQNCFVL